MRHVAVGPSRNKIRVVQKHACGQVWVKADQGLEWVLVGNGLFHLAKPPARECFLFHKDAPMKAPISVHIAIAARITRTRPHPVPDNTKNVRHLCQSCIRPILALEGNQSDGHLVNRYDWCPEDLVLAIRYSLTFYAAIVATRSVCNLMEYSPVTKSSA